jgi:uracil phosphoribosyltransferase
MESRIDRGASLALDTHHSDVTTKDSHITAMASSSSHNKGDESTKLGVGDDHDAAVKKFEEDGMIHISKHPVLSHKITILRSSATPCGTFRAALKEITYHLGYEATMDLTTIPVDISVPDQQDPRKHCDYQGSKLKEHIALVPILRSGLCMVDSMLELLPNAAVHHIGMYKAKHDQLPVQYYNRLPRQCRADIAFVLDTLIATSTTISCVISTLKKVP